jgi:hypothetical protein
MFLSELFESSKFLTELRRNNSVNYKRSALEELQKYKNRLDVYVSYTTDVGKQSHEDAQYTHLQKNHQYGNTYIDPSRFKDKNTKGAKLGINPKSSWDNTPLGIYSYPVEYVLEHNGKVPFSGDEPYLQVFQETGRMLDLENYSRSDMTSDIAKIFDILKNMGLKYADNIPVFDPIKISKRALVQTYGGMIWNITRVAAFFMENIINNTQENTVDNHFDPYENTNDEEDEYYEGFTSKKSILSEGLKTNHIVQWAKLFRMLGYEGAVDRADEGIIHVNEPTQAVFFSIKGIKPLETIRNINPKPSNSFTFVEKNPNFFMKFVNAGKLTIEEILALMEKFPDVYNWNWEKMPDYVKDYFKKNYISIILNYDRNFISCIPLDEEELTQLFKSAKTEQISSLVEATPYLDFSSTPEIRKIIINAIGTSENYPNSYTIRHIQFTEDEVIEGIRLNPARYDVFSYYFIRQMPKAAVYLFDINIHYFVNIYLSLGRHVQIEIMTPERAVKLTKWLMFQVNDREFRIQFGHFLSSYLCSLYPNESFEACINSIDDVEFYNYIDTYFRDFPNDKILESILILKPKLIEFMKNFEKSYFTKYCKHIIDRIENKSSSPNTSS